VVPPKELLRAIHPDKGRATLVLKAYFDESGIHAGSKIVTMAGFIADEIVWEEFDKRWAAALTVAGHNPLLEFKTYDCVHGVHQFSAPGWSFAERLALIGTLVTIITETNLMAIGSSVVRKHLNPLLSNEWFRHKVTAPYYLCFEHCVQMAVGWTRRYSTATGKRERVALIFDVQRAFAPFALELFRQYEASERWKDDLASISFASSEEFSPLQAADIAAYGTGDLSAQRYYPSERPDFPIGPVFERLITNVAAAGGVFDEESLKILVVGMIDADRARLDDLKNRFPTMHFTDATEDDKNALS
jgi:hypothetical protein